MNFEPERLTAGLSLGRIKQSRDLYRGTARSNFLTNHSLLSAFYDLRSGGEWMLRRSSPLKTMDFDGRHDLDPLLVQSGLLDLNPPRSALGDDAAEPLED